MEIKEIPQPAAVTAFAALGHAGRLAVFRMLMRFTPRPVRPSELAEALSLKPNTLSGYLSDLVHAGLIAVERRGRSLYYHVDLTACDGLVGYLVNDCCRGRPEICQSTAPADRLPSAPFRVLFLCSGNSARSIIAEALLRDLGAPQFDAASAGTQPAGQIHPQAREILTRQGHDLTGLQSKHVSALTADARPFDFVFTVCDRAASEDCPRWPGAPLTAHWGIPDPVATEGSAAQKPLAFAETYDQLRRRIAAFVALDVDGLNRLSLQHHIDQLSLI